MPPQREHPVDHGRRRVPAVQRAQRPDVAGERQHRVLGRRPQRAGRGHRRRHREPLAAHRPGRVHQQADRDVLPAPVAGGQLVEVRGPPLAVRGDDPVHRRVDVEVTAPAGRDEPRARRTAADGAARPRPVDDQPGREPPGLRTQRLVGGVHEVGDHRQRPVRVRGQRPLQRLLVERADLGGDVREAGVPRQRRAADGAGAGRVLLGVPALLGLARRSRRAQASPGSAPSPASSGEAGGAPKTCSYSSRTTSSGSPARGLVQPDPARQRHQRRVQPRLPVVGRHRAHRRQPGGDRDQVDRAAHRGADPDVRVRPGTSDQVDDPRPPGGVGRPAQRHDVRLGLRGLVVHRDPAGAVVDRRGDPLGAHRVERVHRRDQPEPRLRPHQPEPRHGQLGLGHHRDQDVQRLLGDPVDLLDVQQAALAQRPHQRAVDEDVGGVPLGEHLRRVEVPDQPGRGQLGVALDEVERRRPLRGDGPQQRRLPRPRRALEQHVRAAVEGGHEQLDLAGPVEDGESVTEHTQARASGRRCRGRSCR